jgi:hypothetical protein
VTGGTTAAVRAVGLLGGMLTYAKEVGYIERNPAHGIRKPTDKRRSFRLAPEEYRALGQALVAEERKGEHWQATAAIRLIAVTGVAVRKSCISSGPKSMLEGHACGSGTRKRALLSDHYQKLLRQS